MYIENERKAVEKLKGCRSVNTFQAWEKRNQLQYEILILCWMYNAMRLDAIEIHEESFSWAEKFKNSTSKSL